MKKIFIFLFTILNISNTFANVQSRKCFSKLLGDASFMSSLTKIIKDGTEKLPDRSGKEEQAKYNILEKSNKITQLFSEYMFNKPAYCYDDILSFAKREKNIEIAFQLKLGTDNILVDFNIDINKLFDYYQNDYAIFVYNKNKNFGDKIKKTDIQSNYWTNECSDLSVKFNIDDDSSINITGQKTFNIKDSEFYLSPSNKPFYGMIMLNIGVNRKYKDSVLIFKHLPTAIKLVEDFSKNLQNSACSNQGLVVYLSRIDKKESSNSNEKLVNHLDMLSINTFSFSTMPIFTSFINPDLSINEITIFSEPYFIR